MSVSKGGQRRVRVNKSPRWFNMSVSGVVIRGVSRVRVMGSQGGVWDMG